MAALHAKDVPERRDLLVARRGELRAGLVCGCLGSSGRTREVASDVALLCLRPRRLYHRDTPTLQQDTRNPHDEACRRPAMGAGGALGHSLVFQPADVKMALAASARPLRKTRPLRHHPTCGIAAPPLARCITDELAWLIEQGSSTRAREATQHTPRHTPRHAAPEPSHVAIHALPVPSTSLVLEGRAGFSNASPASPSTKAKQTSGPQALQDAAMCLTIATPILRIVSAGSTGPRRRPGV